jgi:hypothetical protein
MIILMSVGLLSSTRIRESSIIEGKSK